MAAKGCKGPDRDPRYDNVMSVYLPAGPRARLKARAAAAGIPVSQLVVAWIELGDLDVSIEKLRGFAALPLEVAPQAVRSAVAKMQMRAAA